MIDDVKKATETKKKTSTNMARISSVYHWCKAYKGR